MDPRGSGFPSTEGAQCLPLVRNRRPNSAHPCPRLLELQAIPGAHALGGCTGQPLSVQCLAHSRLHSHVKNAREQAGDGVSAEGGPGCGGGSLRVRVGGQPPDPAFPHCGPGKAGGPLGMEGAARGWPEWEQDCDIPSAPTPGGAHGAKLNVRGLLMSSRRVKYSPAPEG